MAVIFHSDDRPQVVVYIPKDRRFVHFVDGKYETGDADEIEVLAKSYRHDIEGKEPSTDQEVKVEPARRGRKPKNEQ